MTLYLSYKQKKEFLPLLIRRDGGFVCFYCRSKLTIQNYMFEHLDDDDTDNRLENLVLSCQSCNVTKKFNPELKTIAVEKLQENLSKTIVQGNKLLEDVTFHQPSTEIDINQSNFAITEQYLTERIAIDGSIPYVKVINSCAYVCKEKTGYGSQQCVRNYIDMLTSDEGPFMVTKDDNKKKIIVKRRD